MYCRAPEKLSGREAPSISQDQVQTGAKYERFGWKSIEEAFRHALLCRKTGGMFSRGAECDRLWTLGPHENKGVCFLMFSGLTVNLPIDH